VDGRNRMQIGDSSSSVQVSKATALICAQTGWPGATFNSRRERSVMRASKGGGADAHLHQHMSRRVGGGDGGDGGNGGRQDIEDARSAGTLQRQADVARVDATAQPAAGRRGPELLHFIRRYLHTRPQRNSEFLRHHQPAHVLVVCRNGKQRRCVFRPEALRVIAAHAAARRAAYGKSGALA
jgi:hypothetical protein